MIGTENIVFEDFTLVHFLNLNDQEREMIRSWRNHDDVRRWMYQDALISAEDHARFIKGLTGDRSRFFWLIRSREHGDAAVLSFIKVDIRNKNAYFGMYANPSSDAVGIGRSIDRIAQHVAFDVFGLHSLKLEVIEDNKGVINLHKKMGFQEEGRLKEFVFKNGIYRDVVIMGMTKS